MSEAEALKISGHTHMISLLGNPTHHSLSPATHNLSFSQAGRDTVYLTFDVEEKDLPAIIAAMKGMDTWDGANVTMPLKQAVIPLLDELDEAAELMGAVNVIDCKEGKTKGYNTDGYGFMENLRKHGVDAVGKRVVLLGCGGAGSAILTQAALDGVSHISVFEMPGTKGYDNAETLIPKLHAATTCKVDLYDSSDQEKLQSEIEAADMVFNATPVGMGEGSTDLPLDVDFITPGMVVADVIYHPRETELIIQARSKGCVVVTGLGMMIEQAAAGEKIWYGIDMDNSLIERELFSE